MELHEELPSLLASHEEAPDFLETVGCALFRTLAGVPSDPMLAAGTRIGRYEVIEGLAAVGWASFTRRATRRSIGCCFGCNRARSEIGTRRRSGHSMPQRSDEYETLRELVDDIGQIGPTRVVDEYYYSDSGSSALGAIVAKVSGMPVERFIEGRILEAALRPATDHGLGPYGMQWGIWNPETVDGIPLLFGHGGSDGTLAWGFPAIDAVVLYFTQSRGHDQRVRFQSHLGRVRPFSEFVVSGLNSEIVGKWAELRRSGRDGDWMEIPRIQFESYASLSAHAGLEAGRHC